MSNTNPDEPYIYQPDPPFNKDGTRNEHIYSLGGPGAHKHFGKRYTYAEAKIELAKLKETQ